MIAGNSLKNIIGITIGQELPEFYYEIILFIYFGIAIVISLNNINKLRQISLFVIASRFVIVFLIYGVCIYTMKTYGVAEFKDIPKFDVNNITVMIGNSLFFFMNHHSIPGMVENFTPQRQLTKLLIIGHLLALLTLVSFGFVTLFTFSQYNFCNKDIYPSAILVNISYLEYV
jgi:hypothetical protein